MPNDPRQVALDGVVKVYRTATGEVHALKGVDIDFPPATITALVGPSGSGKSTALKILGGLVRPTAGRAIVAGHDVTQLKRRRLLALRRRSMGFVFQRPIDNLTPHLTVADHIARAAAGRANPALADRILADLALDHRASHRPGQLSGGEQQRLAFAQAVVGAPALVIADEPTAELDSTTADATLESIHRLKRHGIAFVLATHDPNTVTAADDIVELHHGAVRSHGTQDQRLSVIDRAGRIQLPEEAIEKFPDRRARLHIHEHGIWIEPPESARDTFESGDA